MTLRPTKHFVRHYAEMVAAMFLGVAVLGLPTEWALGAFGYTEYSGRYDAAVAA